MFVRSKLKGRLPKSTREVPTFAQLGASPLCPPRAKATLTTDRARTAFARI